MSTTNTVTVNKSLLKGSRFSVQTGTIPQGITGPGAKYPMNVSDISIYDPNYPGGPTQTPLVSLSSLGADYEITIDGDWSLKIKSGDPLQIQRGTLLQEYKVKNLIYVDDGINPKSRITIASWGTAVNLLDSFVDTVSGFPNPSSDTYLNLGRRVESPNTLRNDLVESFTVKMIKDENPDTFSLIATWKVNPAVSITRLRWRSVPRNLNISDLSFNVSVAGSYSDIPSANVSSNTGRGALIQPSVTLTGVNLASGGTGYTYANVQIIGGGGTGAGLTYSISSGAITGMSLASGGTGYTSIPTVVIDGDGSDAAATIDSVSVTGVSVIQQGGNYLSIPTVTVDSSYQIGLTGSVIDASLDIYNKGRVDYIRIINGGYGYTGASVTISGGIVDATATAEIIDGTISNIVLNTQGYGYGPTLPTVTITSSGTGGTGALAVANVDLYSQWVYEDPSEYDIFTKTIGGFKYNIPYEIEILASQDPHFRGLMKYGNLQSFQYYK